MSSPETDTPDTDTGDTLQEDASASEKPEKMNLEVKVESPSTCVRHLTVTIPHDDIERYYDDAFSEMMPKAEVPGFRAGRAPRKLVEQRFRKEMKDQVKGSLLMDSISQVTEDENLSAISEPDFKLDSVVLPDDGPMTFEFNLEVRPEFDMPNWRGLKLERSTREFGAKDIDRQMERILGDYGRLVPHDGPASAGDYVTVNLSFKDGETVISSSQEEVIRIRPVLSFRDGNIEEFDKLMDGVKAGETRQGKTKLTDDAPNEALRGKEITAVFEVLDVKKLEVPELTPQLLEEFGDFDSEADFRDTILDTLNRQLEYRQGQEIRKQITATLTEAADWDLPPDLLKRQSARELERAVLELRRSGFSDAEIQKHENELRQNSAANTARALKEHFILEKIAEEENIDVESSNFDEEIRLIARQSGESTRRVRARLDKGGMMDALRNQIVERKVIDQIRDAAKVKDVPFEMEDSDTEAVDQAAGGGEQADIPDAEVGGQEEKLPEPKDHT
jgi:trigger factor